jgi:glycosyltransferase involved in cell wall biosynthesis
MKRIGIVLGSSPGGGVYQYAQAVLDAFLKLPHGQYELVVAYSHPVWEGQIPAGRAKVIYLRTESLRSRAFNRLWHMGNFSMKAWRKVAHVLDPNVRAMVDAQCDLWLNPSNDSWAFRAPVPALGTIHDLMHIHEPRFPEVGSAAQLAERDFHFRETCRWSRGVVVDSEVGRQHVMDAYHISRDMVYPLPYIAPRYIYDSSAGPSVELPYDLPERFFFYPATFWQHKNHAGLFAALVKLHDKYPGMRLVLAGAKQNGYEDALTMVRQLCIEQHVVFLGFVPESHMLELYRRARALIMPSFFGPTNIPQLEAFVAGCPVATSRIYGIPEQVGDAALLFDPSSVDEIASCMERLWTDDALCLELIERGYAHARRWGPPQFAARLKEIIDTALAHQPIG